MTPPSLPASILADILTEAAAEYAQVLADKAVIANDILDLLANFAVEKTTAASQLAQTRTNAAAAVSAAAAAATSTLEDDIAAATAHVNGLLAAEASQYLSYQTSAAQIESDLQADVGQIRQMRLAAYDAAITSAASEIARFVTLDGLIANLAAALASHAAAAHAAWEPGPRQVAEAMVQAIGPPVQATGQPQGHTRAGKGRNYGFFSEKNNDAFAMQAARKIPQNELLARARELAVLAGGAYRSNQAEMEQLADWDFRVILDTSEEDGFRAVMFTHKSTGKVVISFAGTADWGDWKTNFAQGLGLESEQYKKAIAIAHKAKQKFGANNVELVGHSLGGGLAAAAAMVNDIKATTFNAAGVHGATLLRYGRDFRNEDELITLFRVRGEVLTTLENRWSQLGFIMPDSNGTEYVLPARLRGPITRHSMSEVLYGLDELLKAGE
jgi:hypothetical protein